MAEEVEEASGWHPPISLEMEPFLPKEVMGPQGVVEVEEGYLYHPPQKPIQGISQLREVELTQQPRETLALISSVILHLTGHVRLRKDMEESY